jgi:biotin transporter BioY
VAGMLPFVPLDVCKAALAVVTAIPIRKRLHQP